jgi:hypothetical protein
MIRSQAHLSQSAGQLLPAQHAAQAWHDLADEQDDWLDVAPCEACAGDAQPIGSLGSLQHYRCVCCGWTFAQRK